MGDVVFGAGAKKVVLDYMGRFRIYLAELMNIIPSRIDSEFIWG